MRIRWRNFELPSKVVPDKATLTTEYGRFVIEPFEQGFGHTIGNGLRRVLLSSIEGTAVTALKIEGAAHEFDSLPGVYEDVTDIVLNIKQLRVRYDGTEPITCKVTKKGRGAITGADVQCPGDAKVINGNLHLLTLTSDREFKMELDVKKGRGYLPADDASSERTTLGTIPVDSIYSPVHRVRYSVEATRVGKFTNYDRLILEIWTDGTVTPELALIEAAKIYRKHLNPFVVFESSRDEAPVAEDTSASAFNERNREVSKVAQLLERPISDLELSVRARNCLDGANITSLRELVSMTEADVMNLKNLGKTSLTEIKSKLAEHGLSLGMQVTS
jgi:DNA-directed RNA polymerase subunit alpha